MTKDIEFMDELEAAARMKTSYSSNMMLIAVASLVASFFIWAGTCEIEQLTRGGGQVVPTREIQHVQSLEGGILQELLVGEGDIVEKGQILLRISDVAFASEERGVEARFLSLQAKKARLQAEAKGEGYEVPGEVQEKTPDIGKNELNLYNSRQQELKNALANLDSKIETAQADLSEITVKIKRMKESSALLREELVITQEMVRKKAVPKLEEIRLKRDLNDLDGQIKEAGERKGGLEAELDAAKRSKNDQLDKFRSQALGDLNDVETEIAQLEENLTAISDRVFRTEIRSPVYGVVNKIAIKTMGGVVESAMKLVEIVPLEDELKIMARVPPNEIAFIHPGQDVNVKITAYDSQRYGSLSGRLVRIGANSITDRDGNVFFEVEVSTAKNHLGTEARPLPITPGMVAEIEVITGKRTILEYLAKPILKAKSRALTER